MMQDDLKFNIRRLGPTKDLSGNHLSQGEWLVFMGDTLIYSNRDYQECLRLVLYVVDSYSKKEDEVYYGRGMNVRTFDSTVLLIGVTGFAVLVILGYYLWAAVSVPLILIAIRGILLQDYYHVDGRTFRNALRKSRK